MLTHKTISTTIIASAAVIFALLERFYPYSRGQKLFRRHFLTDWLWYSIAFSWLMSVAIYEAIIPVLDNITGMSQLQLVRHWPVWVQISFFLITHDLAIYWFHRLMHSNKYLWRIHEPHHTPREVDWAAGSRAHIIEGIITGTMEWAPIALLGAPPIVVIYKAAIDAVWGMFIHSNINAKLGPLRFIFNGPELHRWHHSRDVYNVNMATKFSFWDYLWKTAYLPDHKPARYGTEIDWSRNLIKHQTLAFRPFAAEPSESAPPAQPVSGGEAIRAPRSQKLTTCT